MRMNRSYAGGALVAAAAVAGLVIVLVPSHSGRSNPGSGGAPLVAGAATASLGSLRLSNGYVPQPASDSVAAAYFTVKNTSPDPDTLLDVTSPVSTSVGLHDEVTQGGAGTMVAISSIPVPGDGSLSLAPGHKHLMIMNPVRTLKAGDSVEVTLRFARAGSMTVELPVVPFSATLGDDDVSTGVGASR